MLAWPVPFDSAGGAATISSSQTAPTGSLVSGSMPIERRKKDGFENGTVPARLRSLNTKFNVNLQQRETVAYLPKVIRIIQLKCLGYNLLNCLIFNPIKQFSKNSVIRIISLVYPHPFFQPNLNKNPIKFPATHFLKKRAPYLHNIHPPPSSSRAEMMTSQQWSLEIFARAATTSYGID